jgi:hypothetical protein
MIVRAEECRRQLEDTVNDGPDIEALRLTPSDWTYALPYELKGYPERRTRYIRRREPGSS